MKIELHAHTSEISQCGILPAAELIRLYKESGYNALVITNHFSPYTARVFRERGAPDFCRLYHEAFDAAEKIGQDMGLLVLCGYEMHFYENQNDYLVYGMDRSLCADPEALFRMGAARYSELAREHDFLFYQAHPFRNGMTVTSPELLFGIETKNTHPRHDSRNDMAEMWADKFRLHKIGGSDCHQTPDAARSGITTDEPVRNMQDLVRVLRNDLYTIL